MQYKYYENRKTNTKVYEEEAEDYALEHLGITIEPKGEGGTYTQEQLEIIDNIVNDYFYNWVEDYEDDECTDIQPIDNSRFGYLWQVREA